MNRVTDWLCYSIHNFPVMQAHHVLKEDLFMRVTYFGKINMGMSVQGILFTNRWAHKNVVDPQVPRSHVTQYR